MNALKVLTFYSVNLLETENTADLITIQVCTTGKYQIVFSVS